MERRKRSKEFEEVQGFAHPVFGSGYSVESEDKQKITIKLVLSLAEKSTGSTKSQIEYQLC